MAAINPKWLPNINWAWPRDVVCKFWPQSIGTWLRYKHFNIGCRMAAWMHGWLVKRDNKAHYGLPYESLLLAKCGNMQWQPFWLQPCCIHVTLFVLQKSWLRLGLEFDNTYLHVASWLVLDTSDYTCVTDQVHSWKRDCLCESRDCGWPRRPWPNAGRKKQKNVRKITFFS